MNDYFYGELVFCFREIIDDLIFLTIYHPPLIINRSKKNFSILLANYLNQAKIIKYENCKKQK